MYKTLKITKEVYCTLQVEGIHNWPTCPYEEVKYLRDLHRHMFHIKAYKKVDHADRDTEFILLKHQIREYLTDKYWDNDLKLLNIGHWSCEHIAEELINEFNLSKCEVNEDSENGTVYTVEEVHV